MPWHDVAMGVVGPCVYDIAEHFVLRWNFCKRDKYKRDEEYDWLTMTGRKGEHEDLIGVQRPKHPVGAYINHPFSPLEYKRGNPDQGRLIPKDGQAQAGAGLDSGDEFHDAPETPGEHGYTEEQHRMPNTWIADEIKDHHIHRPHLNKNKTLPKLPDETREFEPTNQENEKMTGNDPRREGTVTASGGVKEKSKGYQSKVAGDDVLGGQGTVHAQIIRSSADWSSGILTEQSIQNAYCQIIRDAKHYVYIENQVSTCHTSPLENIGTVPNVFLRHLWITG